MPLTVRLSKRRISKSQAVKRALEEILRPALSEGRLSHPFIGGDEGDGSDVSGSIKMALRVRSGLR
jgi:hypothetical protein